MRTSWLELLHLPSGLLPYDSVSVQTDAVREERCLCLTKTAQFISTNELGSVTSEASKKRTRCLSVLRNPWHALFH